MITKDQIKLIHTILPIEVKSDKDIKAEYVAQFTGDEDKCSTKDLTFIQAEEMIYYIRTGKKKDWSYYATFDAKNKKHMYLLSLCRQIGWLRNINGNTYADIRKLGKWIRQRSKEKKPLKQLNAKQTSILVFQFEKFITFKMKKYVTYKNKNKIH